MDDDQRYVHQSSTDLPRCSQGLPYSNPAQSECQTDYDQDRQWVDDWGKSRYCEHKQDKYYNGNGRYDCSRHGKSLNQGCFLGHTSTR